MVTMEVALKHTIHPLQWNLKIKHLVHSLIDKHTHTRGRGGGWGGDNVYFNKPQQSWNRKSSVRIHIH